MENMVSGKSRKAMKKELTSLKSYMSRILYCEDMNRVHGTGHTDAEVLQHMTVVQAQIKELEDKLNEKK